AHLVSKGLTMQKIAARTRTPLATVKNRKIALRVRLKANLPTGVEIAALLYRGDPTAPERTLAVVKATDQVWYRLPLFAAGETAGDNVAELLAGEREQIVLTPGRWRVVSLFAQKLHTDEIAAKLGVSRHTVKNVRHQVVEIMRNLLGADDGEPLRFEL